MEYFVVVEVKNQHTRLYSNQLENIGLNGGSYIYTMPAFAKKWAAVGDSITNQGGHTQNGYVFYTQRMLGFTSIANISAGGKSLSKPGSSGNPAMCDDSFLATIPTDADIVTIMGGTNDWQNNHPIGEITSTSDTDYCGAINHIIDYFSENRPMVRLVFICPTYGELYGQTSWPDAAHNLNGDSMWDFMEAVKNVCEHRGIPYVPMGQRCGWNNKNIRSFVNDDGGLLHPNTEGGRRMSSVLTNSLKEILPDFNSWK